MKQMLLRLFSRKKITRCDDFGALSGSVLGINPPPLPDIDKLLRGLSGARDSGTRETSFLEFKAHYLPKAGDPSTVDECKWNVVEAMVSMANAWGGCILLGVYEDKTRKDLFPVDIGHKAFLDASPVHEDRHFCAYVQKELFQTNLRGPKDDIRLVFEVSETKRYEIKQEHLDRLRKHVSFHLCHSRRLKGPILAILVRHIKNESELIPVSCIRKERQMLVVREKQEDMLFHRNPKAPDTVQKGWTDLAAYCSDRDKNRPDFSKVAKNLLFRIDGRRVHRLSRHIEELCMISLLFLAVSFVFVIAIMPEAREYLLCFVPVFIVILVVLSALGYFFRHKLAPLNSLRLDATVTLNGRELDVEVWRIVTENKNVKSKWRYCYEVHLRWADSLEDAPFRIQQFFVYDKLDWGLRRGTLDVENVDLDHDGYEDLAIIWRGSKKDENGKPRFWAKAVFLFDPKTQDLDLSRPVCDVSDAVLDEYGSYSDIPKKEFMLGYFPVGNRMVPLIETVRIANLSASMPAQN